MRDPARIDEFCRQLAEIWKQYCPDWRFSQFIINSFGSFEADPWYWEEDKMIEYIKNYFQRKGEK